MVDRILINTRTNTPAAIVHEDTHTIDFVDQKLKNLVLDFGIQSSLVNDSDKNKAALFGKDLKVKYYADKDKTVVNPKFFEAFILYATTFSDQRAYYAWDKSTSSEAARAAAGLDK